MAIETAEAARQLVLAARALSDAVATAALPDDILAALIAETAMAKRSLDGTLVQLAGLVHERSAGGTIGGFARRLGHRSEAALIADQLRVRSGVARQMLDVATAPLPRLVDAVCDGSASIDQAAAYLGGIGTAIDHADAEGLAAADDAFIGFALDDASSDTLAASPSPASPEQLAKIGTYMAAHIDPTSLDLDDERMQAERRLTVRRLDGGMVRLSALLPPEQGAVVQRVIDAIASPARHVAFREGDDVDEPVADDRSTPQRKADALTEICARDAASGAAPTIGGKAPTLVVSVAYDEILGLDAADGDRLFALTGSRGVQRALHGGTPAGAARILHTDELVPSSVAARMLCDANVQVAFTDDDGAILDLGREVRLFTPEQRRALIMRDGTCQAPGCMLSAEWCEAHHVIWWSLGGPTDLGNGIMLCRFHHVEVHAGRLRIDVSPPGSLHPFVVSRTASRGGRSRAEKLIDST